MRVLGFGGGLPDIPPTTLSTPLLSATRLGDPYPVGSTHEYGVMQRLYPHWYIIGSDGRHIQDGETFIFGALRQGRFTFAFSFIAGEGLTPDDTVRVEFPEFGCARSFQLGAAVQRDDLFVVQNYLDLKPALVKIGNGGVEHFA